MHNKIPRLYFLLALIIAISILVFFILRPFLYTIILAITFAVLFFPIYERILSLVRQRKSIAAILTTFLFIIFILTPLVAIGTQIFKEAWQMYFYISQDGAGNNILGIIKDAVVRVQEIIPIPFEASANIDQYLKSALTWLLQHLGVLFSSIAQFALHSFLFLFSFYYILKDGAEIRKRIFTISPLADSDDELIFKKLHAAINSVIRGNLLVAIIQGALAGIGLAIFDVPNPVLWGSMATITSLLPTVGTSLITIPSIVFLFINGATANAIGLAIWALTVVGLIDNLLSPKLIGRGIRIHPLLILLSVLGGISFFGPIGFLLGPLTLSFLFTLVETYFSLENKAG